MSKTHEEIKYDPLPVLDKPKLEKPPLYKVVLLNDDFTPMNFVVDVLCQFFYKASDEATNIMLEVHQQGKGLCGVFTYEIAETKVSRVNTFSHKNGHPLQCMMEEHSC